MRINFLPLDMICASDGHTHTETTACCH